MRTTVDRRRFIFAAGMAAMVGGAASARGEINSVRLDGLWWTQIDDLDRAGFVIGFMTMAAKAQDTTAFILHELAVLKSAKSENLIKNNLDFSGIRYSQYLDGLSSFYKDFRNQRILIEDSLRYIRDEVRGRDPSKLESDILLLRKFATSE